MRKHPPGTTNFTTSGTISLTRRLLPFLFNAICIGIAISISVCRATTTKTNLSIKNTKWQQTLSDSPALTKLPHCSFVGVGTSKQLRRRNSDTRLYHQLVQTILAPSTLRGDNQFSTNFSYHRHSLLLSSRTSMMASNGTTPSIENIPLPSTSSITAAISFARLANKLKTTPRTGWFLRHVPDAESVADHSWRVAVLSLLLLSNDNDSNGLDVAKCLEMAIVHDLAESIVGDIAPGDNVEPGEKKRMEEDAMEHIARLLGLATTDHDGETKSSAQQRLLSVFHEYELRQSPEAIAVKDLDLLDMILQAQEYEEMNPGLELDDFFVGTPPSRFRNARIRAIAEEVHNTRAVDVERRKKQGEMEGEKLAGESCALTADDNDFVESYAASSGLAKTDVKDLLRSLRKRDADLNSNIDRI